MSLDRLVVARSAAAGVLLAVPAALGNVVLSSQDDRSAGLSFLSLVVLVLGFLVAGFVAGLLTRRDVARHGAAAALAVVVIVEVIAVLGRLDRGDGISLFSILFTGFLAAAAGAGGANLGSRRAAGPDLP